MAKIKMAFCEYKRMKEIKDIDELKDLIPKLLNLKDKSTDVTVALFDKNDTWRESEQDFRYGYRYNDKLKVVARFSKGYYFPFDIKTKEPYKIIHSASPEDFKYICRPVDSKLNSDTCPCLVIPEDDLSSLSRNAEYQTYMYELEIELMKSEIVPNVSDFEINYF